MNAMGTRILRAGGAYFVMVFAVAFVLGTLRTLIVTPALGALPAVLLEVPLLLLTSWWVAGFVIRRFLQLPTPASGLAMGLLAFVLLMIAEALLFQVIGVGGFGGFLATFHGPEGVTGLMAQIAFGFMPLLRMFLRRDK